MSLFWLVGVGLTNIQMSNKRRRVEFTMSIPTDCWTIIADYLCQDDLARVAVLNTSINSIIMPTIQALHQFINNRPPHYKTSYHINVGLDLVLDSKKKTKQFQSSFEITNVPRHRRVSGKSGFTRGCDVMVSCWSNHFTKLMGHVIKSPSVVQFAGDSTIGDGEYIFDDGKLYPVHYQMDLKLYPLRYFESNYAFMHIFHPNVNMLVDGKDNSWCYYVRTHFDGTEFNIKYKFNNVNWAIHAAKKDCQVYFCSSGNFST